ncbi:hypothetical protein [Halobaculum rarum]|uniref:hypothetical protein n=1 Tax=Halobaculum rarum TaxID=3075122 RepID=UPI0032AFE065
MPDNSLSTSPDTDIQEWVCPYCEQTRQSLPEIRDHITESTEGAHRGIDGLKPTRDILAYGTNGEIVDRVEGVSTEPADPIDEYDKREIIINSWLAADRDPNRRAVEAISDATQQYVSKLLNDIESGEIPRETWVEAIDYGLKDELEERLRQYEPEDDTEDTMSAQTTATAEDIVEEAPKKDRIIAAHRISPSADKQAVADALGVSYEYVRQIFNDIDSAPEEWQKLRDGDLDEDPEPELRDAVEQRLVDSGALVGEQEEQSEIVSRERASAEQVKGMVRASEIDTVIEKLELLQEQAEYTQNGDAEFVAKKCIEWLDELIEQAE